MAALDFPSSPTVGQIYSAPNGAMYSWDGAAWTVSGVISTGTTAGGDLTGTYPNPTVEKASGGGFFVPTGKVTVPGPSAGADQASIIFGTRTAKGRVNAIPSADYIGISNNDTWNGTAWAQDNVAIPSMRLEMNQSDQFYIARRASNNGAETALLRCQGSDGKTYCTLADTSVTGAMLAINATIHSRNAAVVASFANATPNTWLKIQDAPAITVRSNAFMFLNTWFAGYITANPTGGDMYFGVYRDGGLISQMNYTVKSPVTANVNVPIPPFSWWDQPAAGSHTYGVWCYQGTNTLLVVNSGVVWVTEFS